MPGSSPGMTRGVSPGEANELRALHNFQTAKTKPNMLSRPRGAMRPSRAFSFRPKEGVGNAGCPLHPRSRVHLVVVERTRVTTSTPESPGIPARNGFTAYFVLSPVTGLFCHRRQRIGLV